MEIKIEEMKEDKKWNLKVINNERLVISRKGMNTYSKRKVFNGGRKKSKGGFISRHDYAKTLKRIYSKLELLNIDSSKCKFITLTLSQNLSWNSVMDNFKQFLYRFQRDFGKVEYIRGVEIQSVSKYFHIHLVVIFPDTIPLITSEWLNSNWEYGFTYIDEEINVYDIWGLLQYLTKYKDGSCQENDPTLTLFPKGAKIISMSYGIPKAEVKRTEIDNDIYQSIKQYCDTNNKPVNHEWHYFMLPDGRQKYCLDRTHIHDMKDFIQNMETMEE